MCVHCRQDSCQHSKRARNARWYARPSCMLLSVLPLVIPMQLVLAISIHTTEWQVFFVTCSVPGRSTSCAATALPEVTYHGNGEFEHFREYWAAYRQQHGGHVLFFTLRRHPLVYEPCSHEYCLHAARWGAMSLHCTSRVVVSYSPRFLF